MSAIQGLKLDKVKGNLQHRSLCNTMELYSLHTWLVRLLSRPYIAAVQEKLAPSKMIQQLLRVQTITRCCHDLSP